MTHNEEILEKIAESEYPAQMVWYMQKTGGITEIKQVPVLTKGGDETVERIERTSKKPGFIAWFHTAKGQQWYEENKDVVDGALRSLFAMTTRVGK